MIALLPAATTRLNKAVDGFLFRRLRSKLMAVRAPSILGSQYQFTNQRIVGLLLVFTPATLHHDVMGVTVPPQTPYTTATGRKKNQILYKLFRKSKLALY